MPVTELNHYLLVAKDLERTRDFYQQVLGLELAERPDFGFPGYWLKTGEDICVHLASQEPNETRDMFLLKKHPRGTAGSGSVDHIAFLAKDPHEVRSRIRENNVEMHFRSFPDAKLFQIFLKNGKARALPPQSRWMAQAAKQEGRTRACAARFSWATGRSSCARSPIPRPARARW
jgi:catechol 2,3-dioxygenase-like lactoylglutathione lyase family enzyme